MADKIDSNVTGLSYAEESSLGVISSPTWYPLEPNEYSDFGGETTTVTRTTINASRQRKKGTVTDLSASGGFGQDLTQQNLQRLMQGFFFADARERPANNAINGKAANTIAIVDVSATGPTVNVGSGDGAKLAVGMIIKVSGMANPENNRIMVISAIATDALTVDGTLVNETAPATATIEVVGYEFADAVAGIVFTGSEVLTLTRSSGDFTAENFNVGEWIFIGGDATANRFANNEPGYARIEAISASALTLREPTWTPVTEAGAGGKTIRIFYGRFLRNENDQALIKRRTYQLERTLGNDGSGIQSEYLIGSVANEFTLNVVAAEKLTADLSFQALTNETRNGTTGIKSGTRKTLVIEDAYNSANDAYQLRLFVKDPTKATPSSLFARVLEANIGINNGATGRKAIGTLGSFDITVGDFVVSGTLEVYFSTVAAIAAVKANSDVGLNMIFAKDNAGIVYDMPLLGLGDGKLNVEKDEPVMLPLSADAVENEFGYTLGMTFFGYLPTVAMPTVV